MSNLYSTDRNNQTILLPPAQGNDRAPMDVNAYDNHTDPAGRIPHFAVRDALPPLVQPGADLEALNSDVDTALISAVTGGNVESVRFLLAVGPDVNHPNQDGWTPLVALLGESGGDLNAFSPRGEPSLTSAVQDEDLKTVRFLLALGADLNHVSLDGWTPLHSAILARSTSIAAVLVRHDADLEAVNPENETSVVKIGVLEMVDVLLQLGADVNGVNEDRCTALAQRGSPPIIGALAHTHAADFGF